MCICLLYLHRINRDPLLLLLLISSVPDLKFKPSSPLLPLPPPSYLHTACATPTPQHTPLLSPWLSSCSTSPRFSRLYLLFPPHHHHHHYLHHHHHLLLLLPPSSYCCSSSASSSVSRVRMHRLEQEAQILTAHLESLDRLREKISKTKAPDDQRSV